MNRRQFAKRTNRCLLLLAASAACFTIMASETVSRADVIIDSFQDRPANFPLSIQANSNGTGSGILGGVAAYNHVVGGRGISLGITGTSDSDSVTVDISNTGGATFLSYAGTMGATGSITVQYGTIQVFNDPSGLQATPMGLSISPDTTYLRLAFAAYNHANNQDMGVGALLETGLFPNDSSASVSETLSSAGPQFVDFPLAALPGNILNSVTFEFSAPPGTEFQLDSVSLITIPEPGSFLLLAPWVAACLRRRKSAGRKSR